MTITFYVYQFLRTLAAGCIIYFGYLSFGRPEIFDRLFIVVVSLLFLLHSIRRDTNIISVLLIIVFIRLIDESTYFLTELPLSKLFIYTITPLLLYYLRGDKWIKKLAAPCYVIALIAELYWLQQDYIGPEIHYSIALIVLNFIGRYLYIMRALLLGKYISNIGMLDIDFMLSKVSLVCAFLISFQLVEYILRHSSQFKPILIYSAYPTLQQCIAIYMLFLITDYVFSSSYKIKA